MSGKVNKLSAVNCGHGVPVNLNCGACNPSLTGLEATLSERGSRYGDFSDHAAIAQRLQDVMRESGRIGDAMAVNSGWHGLSQVQKQALTVIADKIARILSGDPDYADNWHDIQGYAKLVEDRLP